MSTMKNKYGTCVCNCGAKVKRGAMIQYDAFAPFGKRVTGCATCGKLGAATKQAEPNLAQAFDMAYEDQCSDMCGL
jgi:hypothetical protein